MAKNPIISSGKPHTVKLSEGSNVATHKAPPKVPSVKAPEPPARGRATARAASAVYPKNPRPVTRKVESDPPAPPPVVVAPAAPVVPLGNEVARRIAELKRRNEAVRVALVRQALPAAKPL